MNTSPHHAVWAPMIYWKNRVEWVIHVQAFWVRHSCLHTCTELQQMLVESALARGDVETAERMLVDWRLVDRRHLRISKFESGDHYYVTIGDESEKFASWNKACDEGRRRGFNSFSLLVVSTRAEASP